VTVGRSSPMHSDSFNPILEWPDWIEKRYCNAFSSYTSHPK
jgi:hypothetical protein